jgi:hypothetical protein
MSPAGTAEIYFKKIPGVIFNAVFFHPSLWDLGFLRIYPGIEMPGYYQPSLRDCKKMKDND